MENNTGLELNPRDVLHELNQLGYVQIGAEQLKMFMNDLKRLMRHQYKMDMVAPEDPSRIQYFHHLVTPQQYDQDFTVFNEQKQRQNTQQQPPNVHTTSRPSPQSTQVASISTASLSQMHAERRRDQTRARIPIPPHNTARSVDHIDTATDRPTTSPATTSRPTTTTSTESGQRKQHRPESAPKLVRNTPTDLYQYYARDWHRFRQTFPGEASRTNVRTAIRLMMEQPVPPKPRVYLAMHDDQTKSIYRK